MIGKKIEFKLQFFRDEIVQQIMDIDNSLMIALDRREETNLLVKLKIFSDLLDLFESLFFDEIYTKED